MKLKKCPCCKKIKKINEFHKNRNRGDGHNGTCKTCCGLNLKTKYKGWVKNYLLKKTFGITLEDYDNLLEKQNNGCAICGGININGHRLAVDHDHVTGQVRGLLCNTCNVGLGHFKEDITLLFKVITYLNNVQG